MKPEQLDVLRDMLKAEIEIQKDWRSFPEVLKRISERIAALRQAIKELEAKP